MKPINVSRVLLGSVVAWLIVGVGEAIHLPMLDASTGALADIGATDPGALQVLVGTLVILTAAVLFMWVYAVMRDRYGPGPATALRIGLVFAFFTHVLPSFALWMLGAFPLNGALFHSVWGLIEVPIALLAGAALYKEAAPSADAAKVVSA